MRLLDCYNLIFCFFAPLQFISIYSYLSCPTPLRYFKFQCAIYEFPAPDLDFSTPDANFLLTYSALLISKSLLSHDIFSTSESLPPLLFRSISSFRLLCFLVTNHLINVFQSRKRNQSRFRISSNFAQTQSFLCLSFSSYH